MGLRLISAVLILVFGAMAANARISDPQIFTLKNGLQLVVIEDTRAPVVQHMIWYRAGAADEAPGASGAAHFLEHLLFKGTAQFPDGAFSTRVSEIGGQDNAFTSWDYTAYYQRVPATALPEMMEMEADRMRGTIINQDALLTERKVILEERAMRVDNNPDALFSEQMGAAQFLNHPYGRPIIGWPQEASALDMADVRAFYDRFYAPQNAIVIVAGDVTARDVLDVAQDTYGQIPRGADHPTRARPQEPPQLAERRLAFTDARVAQPSLIRSYLAPERNPGDQSRAAALTLLAALLSDPQTGVLTQKLQLDAQIASHAAAYYSGASVDMTSFDIVLMPRADVPLEQAEAALDQALQDFLASAINPDDLTRLKRQIRANEIYRKDNSASQANHIGRQLAVGLTLQDVQEWPQVLQSVTGDNIMAAARDLLRPNPSVTGWLRPANPTGGAS